MKNEKEMKQETIRFFRALSEKTKDLIDIFYIKDPQAGNGLRLQIASGIKMREAYTFLAKENAYWKNYKYGENVYFAPSAGQKLNFVFIDDPEDIDYYEDAFLVVQTSSQNVQAYYLLDKYISINQITAIQRHLCDKYNADKGSIDALHLRRIPGFYNTKYPDMPIVKILYIANTPKYIAVEEEFELENTTKTRANRANKAGAVEDSRGGVALEAKEVGTGEYIEDWKQFYRKDKNIADIHYVYSLIAKGFGYEEIHNRLYSVRFGDVIDGKKHNFDDYIRRTYLKAKIVYVVTQENSYKHKTFMQIWAEYEHIVEGIRIIDKLENILSEVSDDKE